MALKGYCTALQGDQEALNDRRITLTSDEVVLKDDGYVFQGYKKALKMTENR